MADFTDEINDSLMDLDIGIDDTPGDGNNANQTATGPTTREGSTNESTAQSAQNGQGVGAVSNNDGASQNQQSQQQQRTGGSRPREDAQHNLVDPTTGEVIARAGSERRHYEDLQRTRRELDQVRSELQQYQNLTRTTQELPGQLGLQPQEVQAAMRIMHGFKTDPVKTIQYLLTQAQAAGYNVGVGEQSLGLTPEAVRQMVNQAVAPLVQDRQNVVRQNEQAEQARRVVTDFFNHPDHADGTVHADAIAKLIAADPTLDLRGAYYRLKLFATQNGLDWSQPLQPQIVARQNGSASTNLSQPPQQNRGAPMPSGNNPSGVVGVGQPNNPRPIAGSNARTSDIVRDAMREFGMSYEG